MKTSLLLLFGSPAAIPVQPNETRVRGNEDMYGSWGWFIDQIADNNKDAKPTESVQTASPSARTSRRNRQNRQRVAPQGSHKVTDDNRFDWFNRNENRFNTNENANSGPVILSQRSSNPALVAGSVLTRGSDVSKSHTQNASNLSRTGNVQFIGSTSDNNALMYNTFVGEGSGFGSDRSITSFSAQSSNADFYSMYADEYEKNQDRTGNSNGALNYALNEKPSNQGYTFNTNVHSDHFNPWSDYTFTRVADGELLPVQVVNEWPSNTSTLGGAIFEVVNFIFGETGTCYINLPTAVYWFHVFNAHIDPSNSDPSSGVYAIVAANQAFEGKSTLDFIVNFQSDDLRFDGSQIELTCDSTDGWTSSIYSFPGNTVGDVARTNVRRPNDGNGFNDKKIIVEFPYNVEEFYVDDARLTVSTGGNDNTSGKTFEITGLTDSYLEEVWFGWNYVEGGWFTAADTSVSIFDDDTN